MVVLITINNIINLSPCLLICSFNACPICAASPLPWYGSLLLNWQSPYPWSAVGPPGRISKMMFRFFSTLSTFRKNIETRLKCQSKVEVSNPDQTSFFFWFLTHESFVLSCFVSCFMIRSKLPSSRARVRKWCILHEPVFILAQIVEKIYLWSHIELTASHAPLPGWDGCHILPV